MKAVCHREGLLAAFQLASVALPSRERESVKPILKNLKAIAEADRCTLMATDLELGIRLEVRGLRVEEPGEAILPAAKMLAILRESHDEELSVTADADACVVRNAAGSEWEMPSEDPAHFPDIPSFAEEKYHQMSAGDLRLMIRRTVFAAAAEAGRQTMNGVLWDADGDRVRLVATDGRRLAMAEGPAIVHGGHTTQGSTPIVPTKAMNLLERNLQGDDDEQVKVCFRPNEALFRTETAVIYSRLVEGRYPDYRRVFPKKTSVKVPLSVTPFLTAIRQAAILVDEETRRVVFHFTPRKLSLESQGAATGRSKVEMPLEYEGKTVDINFNPGFVVEMLRVLDADAPLELEMNDGSSAALFRSGPTYSYLVMPLA